MTRLRELVLERRGQEDKTVVAGPVLMTPDIDEDYWAYRVKLTDQQAVIGFPKFGTIGIGFAKEEDWNSNLPYAVKTEKIVKHIWHNVGDKSIKREDVVRAVQMIRDAVAEDRPEAVERFKKEGLWDRD